MSKTHSLTASTNYPHRPHGPVAFALVADQVGETTTLIRVIGEFDATAVDQLFEAIERAPKSDATIVVALDQCEFVDSTAIAAIVQISAELEAAEGRLRLCAPSPAVRRTLEIVGLAEAGLVVDDLETVLRANG
jgi:stage II sporulation protein AA (anti-sigma F factor antagonist)